MKVLNGYKKQDNCPGCLERTENFFCNLPEPALQFFESLKITNAYPKGTALFFEGQQANGIYMLCEGRVKLSTCSRDGKVIILHIAAPGEVLGLSAVVSGSCYEATAEVLERCQVSYIRKADFLRFLRHNAEASFSAVKQLSQTYQTAYTQIRSLGLSNSVTERLAKLFLQWCRETGKDNRAVQLKISFTHEEIAGMIGTSRETVSRLFKDFKDKKLITVKGSDLIIHDRLKLEKVSEALAFESSEMYHESNLLV